jgi:hypothetical protein
MRVESREVEFAGEQGDHGANLGDPALTARLAHMPRCGNTQGSLKYLFNHGGQTGCQQVAALRLPTQFSTEAFRYCRCTCNAQRAFGGFPNMIHGRIS